MDWFYAKYGKQEGPVDGESLRAKVQSGEVSATDLVWRDGMAEWQPAGQVAELQGTEAGDAPGPVAVHPGSGLPVQSYPGAPVGAVVPTSGLAITSLVCGIVGIFLCYVHAVCALPAVICGHMALKQIRESPVPIGGKGMAVAGLVTGYIALLFQVLTIGIIVFAVMAERN